MGIYRLKPKCLIFVPHYASSSLFSKSATMSSAYSPTLSGSVVSTKMPNLDKREEKRLQAPPWMTSVEVW